MIVKLARRMLRETDKRALAAFVYNFGWKGMRAVGRFQKRLQRGEFFPAFTFISITNNCNLSCQGCWVTVTKPSQELDLELLDAIVSQCREQGSSFFGILGGEPLMHGGLFDLMGRYPDCYFVVFTNGTLITEETAKEMRRLSNVSPLISIEGSERVSDQRRGGAQVYSRTMRGLELCRKNRLIIGAATSVCRSNIDDLASEAFVNELVKRGVHYVWYYIYRPVGAKPAPELALSKDQIRALRRFIVDIRSKAPIVVVDAYWDHLGWALCPAATGISHHISPAGYIEPCPPIQFAAERIGVTTQVAGEFTTDGTDNTDGREFPTSAISVKSVVSPVAEQLRIRSNSNLRELFDKSVFLAGFRKLACETTRGCILMERPDLVRDFVVKMAAQDSSGRNTGIEELSSMRACPSHDMSVEMIPEKHWLYRFAKKHWFFGFGAYG